MALNVEKSGISGQRVFDLAIGKASEEVLKENATDEQWARWLQYKALVPVLSQPDPLPMSLEAASYSQSPALEPSAAGAEIVATGGAVVALAIAAPYVLLVGATVLVLASCGGKGVGPVPVEDTFEETNADGPDLAADVYDDVDLFQRADGLDIFIPLPEVDGQGADNTVDLAIDAAPDHVYDPAYKDCFLFPPAFPRTPNPEELMEVLKYDAEEYNNFYKEIHIYYPLELSASELESLAESVNVAAEFVQMLTGKYYKMPPRYDVLEIYFRFSEIADREDKSGVANGNQIFVNREQFEKALKSGATQTLSGVVVHEMMHTYVQPTLAEDANNICNEGNSEISQHAFLAHTSTFGFGGGYGLFPDEPVEPLFAAQFKDGLDEFFSDDNGDQHNIKIKAFEEDGGLVFIDGKVHYAAQGTCEDLKVDKFFICNDFENDTVNTLVFNQSDVVIDDVADMPYEDKGSKYLKIYDVKTIWGKNINGVPEMFREPLFGFSSLPFQFSQDAYYEKSVLEYRAAYGMLLLLQQMYRDVHPDAQPNQFLSIIGGAYNDYVKENCENGYQLPTTNIYHRLCEGMDVDVDQCLDIFESFGLDIDWFLK